MKCFFYRFLVVIQILSILMFVPAAFSDTNVGGAITSATTWTADNSPYVVTSTIWVYFSARLTIEPGVTVKFNTGTALWIGHPSNDGSTDYRGNLTAIGTSDSKITFTSSSDSSNGWQGIIFGPRSDDYSSSSLQYCIIEKAGETNSLGEQANVHLYHTGSGDAIFLDQVEVNESAGIGLFSSNSYINLSGSILSDNTGFGLYAENSMIAVTSTTATGNSDHGYYISGSEGIIEGGSTSGNNGHGIKAINVTSATFSNITFEDNAGHGVYTEDFQSYITVHNNIFNNNTDYPARISAQSAMYENTFSNSQKLGIELVGGTINSRNARWYFPGTGDYQPYIHSNITTVIQSHYLTVDPGVIVKFKTGSGLEIGHFNNNGSSDYRGGLLVNGSAADPVVFTSHSGLPGGWRGVILGPRSDDYMTSTVSYLTIEKAGASNSNSISANLMLYYAGANSTLFSNCYFNESTGHGAVVAYSKFTLSKGGASDNAVYGIYNDNAVFNGNDMTVSGNQEHGIHCDSSAGSITDSLITNSGDYAIYLDTSSMTVTGNTLSQSGDYAVYYNIGNSNPVIQNNTLSQNTYPGIRIYGGNIAGNHTLYAQNGESCFTVTGEHLSVWYSRRLTVDPGVTLKFSSGLGLWIAHPSSDGSADYRGNLTANGTLDSKIIFTSDSESTDGWQGLLFGPRSDDYSSSSMQYCVIENAGRINYLGVRANVHLYYTGNGFVFNHIIIRNSSNTGLYLNSSILSGSNLHIFNNSGDGVFYNTSSGSLTDSIIVNNTAAGINITENGPAINNNYIANNDYGIYAVGSVSSVINSNVISDNISYGLYAASVITAVNAESNYWGGDGTGPHDSSDDRSTGGGYNPDGTGDQVSDDVDYDPWTDSESDSDGDRLPDFVEALVGTDPNDADTDDDGQQDAWEIQNGLNLLDFPKNDSPVNDDPPKDDEVDTDDEKNKDSLDNTMPDGGGGGNGCFISSVVNA